MKRRSGDTPLLAAPAADTRRAALEAIQPARSRLARAVLAYIAERGGRGATDEEIAAGLGLQADTARARRCELRDAGDVHDSTGRRATHSGRRATVWLAADRPTLERTSRPAACNHTIDHTDPAGTWVERQRGGERIVVCSGCGRYYGHLPPDISHKI